MPIHNIAPVINGEAKALILGSFPSVRSREEAFFYGHPQNRFWRVISRVFDMPEPRDITEKRKLLLSNSLALWDVIASCDIIGSSDSSIKNVIVNDVSMLVSGSKIERIILNGKTAERYFKRYLRSTVSIPSITLPSTSAANAAYDLDRLVNAWREGLLSK